MTKSPEHFVPSGFTVPDQIETEEFRIRTLTVNDVVKDYDAVMSSVDHLRTISPDDGWPENLTLEQNLIDLGWHQKEFQRRRSFAYTVVTLDESQVIGCIYIYPTRKRRYDAEVYLWARQSRLADGLEERIYATARDWLASVWPFSNIAFPARDVTLDDWREGEEPSELSRQPDHS